MYLDPYLVRITFRLALSMANGKMRGASVKAKAVAKKSVGTQHIEWRGKRITLFGTAVLRIAWLVVCCVLSACFPVAESKVYELISTVRPVETSSLLTLCAHGLVCCRSRRAK